MTRHVELPPLRVRWPTWRLLVSVCTVLALAACQHLGPDQVFDVDASTGAPARQLPSQPSSFVLRSPAVVDGGDLPVDFTGDGTSSTLPLEWSNAPAGTKSFALIMHHLAPDGIKWYWIVYDIPASVTRLPKDVKGIGTTGNNSINGRTEYAPPHSKGPGAKTYILTVYALSAAPEINVPPGQVNREVLLAAIKDQVLASAELRVVYTRFPEPSGGGSGNDPPSPTDRGTNVPANPTPDAMPRNDPGKQDP